MVLEVEALYFFREVRLSAKGTRRIKQPSLCPFQISKFGQPNSLLCARRGFLESREGVVNNRNMTNVKEMIARKLEESADVRLMGISFAIW